jgi:hypothetical protein
MDVSGDRGARQGASISPLSVKSQRSVGVRGVGPADSTGKSRV